MQKWKAYELRKALLSTTGLMIVLPLVILVNVALSFVNLRWDTTGEKIYSISEGSKHILAGLSVPVTVRFYWSRSSSELPQYVRLYAAQAAEFLTELQHASNGKLIFEEIDPKPDSDEEEMAQKYGLQASQSPQGYAIFCGLVFLAGEREERIAILDPARQELLEYDVLRIVHQIQSPKKKVVAVISDLPVFGIPAPGEPMRPWIFIQELQKTYEVRDIPPAADTIGSDVDLLMIIHPKTFAPPIQFAIDQYVLGGGNAVVFVDPYCISDGGTFGLKIPTSSLPELFKAWGITMNPMQIVVDFGQSTRVGGTSNTTEDNPLFISVRPESFDKKNVATSRLESMLMGLSGAIEKDPASPYEFEPLLFSSDNAGVAQPIQVNKTVADIRREVASAGKHFTLAAQVRGAFKTAFPDGAPSKPEQTGQEAGEDPPPAAKPPAADTPPKSVLREGTAKSTLVVVADADILADPSYVQTDPQGSGSRMFNDNFNFVANVCELLTGKSDDLIGLRSRGRFQRPFTRVVALQRHAQDLWLVHEQELAKQAEEANRKIMELHGRKDESQKQILSPEQEEEVRKFQEQKLKIDRELKQVRKQFNAEIETLGTKLKIINIFLMAALVAMAGLGFAIFRQRRMRRR